MTRILNRGAAALAILAVAVGFARGAGASPPEELVEKTANQVIEILRDSELPKRARRERVRDVVYEHFDFETMTKLMLARAWRRLAPEQRTAFVEEIRQNLALRYQDRFDGYEGERIDLVGTRPEPRGDVTVRTRIRGGSADGAAVDYRLRRFGDEWRVIDVVIEGVSLVSSYREQFAEVLSSGGPERLLELLREKNRALTEDEAPA